MYIHGARRFVLLESVAVANQRDWGKRVQGQRDVLLLLIPVKKMGDYLGIFLDGIDGIIIVF
jgi:hypothetical protein